MTTASTKLTCGDEIPSPSRPSRETRVRELLKNTHDPKQISHICRLYPFHDLYIPQNVLTQRWNIGLNSFLASFYGREVYNEIRKRKGECKAKELLRLLNPVQENCEPIWNWGWSLLDISSDYFKIARGHSQNYLYRFL
jgi:hypothetical protein